jgi:anti-anti-sigma factor
MPTAAKTVVVKEMPQALTVEETRKFLRDIAPALSADRPRIVLDCSGVRQLDSAGIELLLNCMEQVMKRDGDLKLAAVSLESAVILEITQVDRLFEIFESPDEAVRSFEQFPAQAFAQAQDFWQPGAFPAIWARTNELEIAG